MSAYQILLLLAVGYLVFSIDKKQKYFPVPMVLVVMGVVFSFIPYFNTITITKDFIFYAFLPALLFTSAYGFSIASFKKNKWMISILGTLGLLLTIGLFGVSIYIVGNLFLSIGLVASLLIAAILSPTDPVSVVSILQDSLSNKGIADVVEGESMINDGTSIVVFNLLVTMYVYGERFVMTSFIRDFLVVSIGGVAIGIGFGWLMGKAVHYTSHRTYQVMLSIIIAYGSFYLGEFLQVSGVLATVTAGIMLSYEFNKMEKEESFKDALDGFWKVVEPTVLGLLFLLIGIQAGDYLVFSEWGVAILIFILSLVVRFVVLIIITKGLMFHWQVFSVKDNALVTWSGIKGTMSVALLLGLDAVTGDDSDMLLSITFAAILLSLVIQSIGVYPMAKKLE